MFENLDFMSTVAVVGGALAAIIVFWKNLMDALIKTRDFFKKDETEENSVIHIPTNEEVEKYSKTPPKHKWQKITVVEFFIVLAVVGIFVNVGLEDTLELENITTNNPKPEPIEQNSNSEEIACRDISHGLEKYQFSDVVRNSSGWVDGGRDQNWWCQTMKNQYQSSKQSVSIAWSQQSSSEVSNKDWKGHVTYKYHCTATANTNPIYKLKKSDACKTNN